MSAQTWITAAALLVAGTADARPFNMDSIGGSAQLHYDVATYHDVDHDPGEPSSPQDLVLAGARLHGFIGGKRFGYHLGLDLAAGQTARPHSYLAYDVTLFPVGVAVRFFETSFITFGAGIGANGAVGTVDDATTIPLEVRFELGRGNRLLGRARATYLFNAPGRKDGTVTTEIGDELDAMLGLRLGRAYDEHGFVTADGYFVGANYREANGARYVGITLGMSLDMGTRRTRRAHQAEAYGL